MLLNCIEFRVVFFVAVLDVIFRIFFVDLVQLSTCAARRMYGERAAEHGASGQPNNRAPTLAQTRHGTNGM